MLGKRWCGVLVGGWFCILVLVGCCAPGTVVCFSGYFISGVCGLLIRCGFECVVLGTSCGLALCELCSRLIIVRFVECAADWLVAVVCLVVDCLLCVYLFGC